MPSTVASCRWSGYVLCRELVHAGTVVAVVVGLRPIVLSGQQLLDRVVARVEGYAITLTDVRAALGLGVVHTPTGVEPIEAATRQLIDRQLVLVEVERFPPPEPVAAAIDAEVGRLKRTAGDQLPTLMQSTGVSEQRIRDFARDNLRITAYLDQRFGATAQVSEEEVAQYYRDHEGEFTRNGTLEPFEEAESVARERAATSRRNAAIELWLADLRARSDIAINSASVQ